MKEVIKKQQNAISAKNWGLVFVSSLFFILGVVICFIGIKYSQYVDWFWTFSTVVSGIGFSITSIGAVVYNRSAWLLLNLISPF